MAVQTIFPTSAGGMSPAAQALNLTGVPMPAETEEEKRKRLAALQASNSAINRNLGNVSGLSPAGKYLMGGVGGGI
jgi:hypothetical protein